MSSFPKGITLSDLGNAASILGLLLTILILLSLRSIKRFYIFTARVPELLEKLIKHAGNIASYQKDFSGSNREIDLELAGAEIVLKSLKSKVGSHTKSSVRRVIKCVDNYNRTNQDQEKLWGVYVEFQKLITELQELQSDSKWER